VNWTKQENMPNLYLLVVWKKSDRRKVAENQPQHSGAHTLLGWIDLTSGKNTLVKKSVLYFDKVLSNGSKKDIEVFSFQIFGSTEGNVLYRLFLEKQNIWKSQDSTVQHWTSSIR
jgi:hypothetical protein